MQNLLKPEFPTANRYLAGIRSGLFQLDELELRLVRKLWTSCRRSEVQSIALVFNRLGNGWLYPFVVAALLWLQPARVSMVLAAAGLAVGKTNLIYPAIKRLLARPRPCDIDPSLTALFNPWDRYSFPSGHCMTVTCVLIPVTTALPHLGAIAGALWLLVAWARLAAAHHYPSDLIAGTALGAAIALPITSFLV